MAVFGRPLARAFVASGLLLSSIGAAAAAGALAVGACGAYGFAYDYSQADAAERDAVRKCTSKGCRVVAAMRRNCAAFAVDLRDICGSYGYAAASRLGPAQNSALRQCYSNGGKDCVIRAFVCDAKG